jgi:hypothetical protein
LDTPRRKAIPMPSLDNRYPLELAFARQVGVRFTRIMWVISNGEFSKNLTGESNGIAIVAPRLSGGRGVSRFPILARLWRRAQVRRSCPLL